MESSREASDPRMILRSLGQWQTESAMRPSCMPSAAKTLRGRLGNHLQVCDSFDTQTHSKIRSVHCSWEIPNQCYVRLAFSLPNPGLRQIQRTNSRYIQHSPAQLTRAASSDLDHLSRRRLASGWYSQFPSSSLQGLGVGHLTLTSN